MIKVSFFYVDKANAKFDYDYFVSKHIPFAIEKQKSLGLLQIGLEKGIAGGTPDAPIPYIAIGHIYYDSIDKFQSAMSKVGEELMADVPNFTDIEPIVQISEVLADEILA